MKSAHRNPQFKKSPLALLLAVVLLPEAACALELSQSPPGTQQSYVAPNVLLSLDDSGSMSGGGRRDTLWAAVIDVFSDTNLLPDGKIRLAWQTMENCGNAGPRLTPNDTRRNAMRVLNQTHRANFLSDMNNLGVCGWTPTHQMMRHADEYFRNSSLDINSPWASIPGQQAEPYLGCRRNYHILLTDGGWNREMQNTNPLNFDGTNHSLAGKQYGIASDQTRVYRDTQGTTVSDWAFKSWADPLKDVSVFQNGIGPKPAADYLNAPAKEEVKNRITGASFEFEKYWNPKYNPATWPHLITFTIGFSRDALPSMNFPVAGGRETAINDPTSKLPYSDDGDLAEYANGTYYWNANRDRGHDMWHAAINGRGQFYAVEKSADLAGAFRKIVETISVAADRGRSAMALSGNSTARYSVGLYTSEYDPENSWSGSISANIIQPDGNVVPAPGWGGSSTAGHLDAMANFSDRKVWSWNGVGGVKGVSFEFGALDVAQQKYFLDNPPAGALSATDEQIIRGRIDYVKGDRTKEGTDADKFRPRKSRQGDIVNSNIWYVDAPVSAFPFDGYTQFVEAQKNRQPMIYAGGNDGMLHGFSATDGSEKLAYVPYGVLPTLRYLTKADYDEHHRAYVDGPVMTGDAKVNGNWRTVLIGALGAGGKGYYVLDVTNPTSFGAGNVLLDKTMPASATHGDIGHIFGAPALDDSNPRKASQIARLNNDKWAVIMGNGYNSENKRPVLLIQYLDGTLKTLVAADTVAGEDNGLGTPTLVDLNGDGRPDVVYAGDNMGNLWKFMIADASDSNWGVAFGAGRPLFNARENNSNAGTSYPITAAPAVRYSPEAGGMMVAFGTGRNITPTDANDLTVQSLYAVLDKTQYSLDGGHPKVCRGSGEPGCGHMRPDQTPDPVNGGRTALVAQSFGANNGAHWALTSALVDYTTKRGWYLDLKRGTGNGEGERLLSAMTFGYSSQTLDIPTQIPPKGSSGGSVTQESCEGTSPQAARKFLTRMHIAQPSIITPFMRQWLGFSREMPGGPSVGPVTRDTGWQSPPSTPQSQIQEGYIDENGDFISFGDLPDSLPARPAWWQLQ